MFDFVMVIIFTFHWNIVSYVEVIWIYFYRFCIGIFDWYWQILSALFPSMCFNIIFKYSWIKQCKFWFAVSIIWLIEDIMWSLTFSVFFLPPQKCNSSRLLSKCALSCSVVYLYDWNLLIHFLDQSMRYNYQLPKS